MIHRRKKRGYSVEENNKNQEWNQEAAEQKEQDEAVNQQGEQEPEKELSPLEVLEQKCSEYLNLQQRTLAEFDNFRKRTVKEKAVMYDDGVRSTVEKLLPIIDNLERAVAAQDGKSPQDDSFYKGVQMILTQFQETLKELSVTEIPALGEKFDPNLHAAVAHEDSQEHGENEVMLVMLKGYMYKDKVIRHSMVKVAN